MFLTFSCTAFDTSNPTKSGKTIQCFLYGHSTVQPASGVEGTCFKMATVKPVSAKAAGIKATLENTVDLGEGLCRGDSWQDGVNWPKDKGSRTPKECYTACKQTTGCTAFDISVPKKNGKKVQCFLYGHQHVSPASALEGRCFKMTEIKTQSGDSHGLQVNVNSALWCLL